MSCISSHNNSSSTGGPSNSSTNNNSTAGADIPRQRRHPPACGDSASVSFATDDPLAAARQVMQRCLDRWERRYRDRVVSFACDALAAEPAVQAAIRSAIRDLLRQLHGQVEVKQKAALEARLELVIAAVPDRVHLALSQKILETLAKQQQQRGLRKK